MKKGPYMAGKSRKAQLEELVEAEPDDPELGYFLAMEYVGAGGHEGAARRFAELLRIQPDYVPAYLQAGQALGRLGRDDDARTMYQAGIAAARRTGNTHAAGEMEG